MSRHKCYGKRKSDHSSVPSTNANSSTIDEDAAQAVQIVRAPAVRATGKRYEVSIRMYEDFLREMEIDTENVNTLGEKNRSNDAIAAGLKLILKRCSPKDDSRGCEGFNAFATGTAYKSAVVARHFALVRILF